MSSVTAHVGIASGASIAISHGEGRSGRNASPRLFVLSATTVL